MRFCLAPYECTLAVELDRPEAIAQADSLLLPGWIWLDDNEKPQEVLALRGDSIYSGDELHGRARPRDGDARTGQLHLRLGATARKLAFVHAGVVGYEGRALIIPGRSYTGKSTLVGAGATYYSGEYAVFDSSGQVPGSPVCARRPSRSTRKLRLASGTVSAPTRHHLAHALPKRGKLRLRRLPPGKSVLALELVVDPEDARVDPAHSGPRRFTVPLSFGLSTGGPGRGREVAGSIEQDLSGAALRFVGLETDPRNSRLALALACLG